MHSAVTPGHTVAVFFDDGEESQQAVLPATITSYTELLCYVEKVFKQAQQSIVITDGHKDIRTDEQVKQLQPGQRLFVRACSSKETAVFKERISFNPHPKTLTMAGDYEYFAAQGYHPLAFALAELIDNALRATKGNTQRRRSITVSLVTDDKESKGMVCVRDNGSGMTVQELNNWAVMNLSMEDRGLLSTDEDKAGNRYLSSDISFFGVGSKNAAFYLGKTVKLVTKTVDSDYVHELCIQAAELERRYREGRAVYEEDLLHRQLGDEVSMASFEQSFPLAHQLLQDEGGPVKESSGSFTRVLIYNLKQEVLAQLCDEDDGAGVLRDLAHLYHYYLHGAQGNQFTISHAAVLPNGEQVPDLLVERLHNGTICWSKALVEVDDDLESRYLKAQRSHLEFELSVPNHGRVEGVLWYFPFENDQETVPIDPYTLGRMRLSSHKDGLSQHPGHGPMTQIGPSQMARLGASQHLQTTQAAKGQPDACSEQDANYQALLAACPTFEAFWQGRLIPGACVDTLPFIRNIRMKRNAATRDVLPDEVFSRIRGALFFGPGFRVTRNKLTFRDNLALLLETASPVNRQLEKQFKEWLVSCHKQLDRNVRFEVLCNQSLQAQARKHLGQDVTIFERIHDGLQTISKGDVIKLSTKPTILGRVLHFSIPQVVQSEGCYSGGRVTVCALPEEVLGADNLHTWPLRRLEGLVSADELQEHVDRELSKLPTALRLEPMRLAAGSVLTMPAGTGLPETSISVLSGAGNKIVKALIGGQRQQLKVIQTLYYLGPAGSARKRTAASASQGNSSAAEVIAADKEANAAHAAEEAPVAKKGGKKGKRRKKGVQSAEAFEKENEQPASALVAAGDSKKASSEPVDMPEDAGIPDGEVLLSHENKSPIGDKFQFQRITAGITRAGCYCLQYSLLPELPDGRTLRYTIDLHVAAGPPVSFSIKGEGRAVALSKSLMLGEALPPVRLQLQDSYGNVVPAVSELLAERPVQLQALRSSLATGGTVIPELQVEAQMETQNDELILTGVRVLGPNPPSGSSGMQLFKTVAATGSASQPFSAAGASVVLPVVHSIDVFIAAYVEDLPPEGFPIRLVPGAPHSLRLLDGHPFSPNLQLEEDGPLLTQLALERELVPADIMSGEQLATFKVQALDIWGNPTCPNDVLSFDVVVQCAAAEPDIHTFSVDDRGIATISGVSVYRQSGEAAEALPGSQLVKAGFAQPHQLLLWPHWGDCQQPLLQTALELAQPQNQLGLPLLVHPSNKPARLYITHHGKDLDSRTQEGEEGEQVIWQLTEVEAGSRVEGLAVLCVDEIGRPAEGGVPGRIQVSWAKGSKKATLGSNEIRLPGLQAPDAVGAPQQFWVRFSADQKLYPGVTFDINFEVSVVAGPPHSWSVAIVDFLKGAAAAAKGAAPKDAEELSLIPCGQPFYLEIEVLDQCHNRSKFAAGERPMPVVEATASDPDTELQLDPSAWKRKWDQTQAGGDVCLYKLWVAGPPGPVRLRIRDTAGEDGACLLQEDELSITLLPGPPVALIADCPQELECSTRGVLESLPVRCVDCYGNVAEGADFEVSLNGSAFNDQGVAVRVTAQDSNRIALRKGVAVFRNVRVQAQSEGLYKLTVGSSSRKFVVQEAMVMVKVTQLNYVSNLEILPASLTCKESNSVGCKLHVLLVVHTDDQQPLPLDILHSSMQLKLSAPAQAGTAAGSSKGRKSAQKTDIVMLSPAGIWDSKQMTDSLNPSAAEAAQAQVGQGCVVWFITDELLVAGQYTVAAVYTEAREQLVVGLPKQEQTVCSTSLQFSIAAGPVSTAELTAGGAQQESFTISNGKEAAQRRLLKNAAVQLQDHHNNPTCVPDIPVRWRLSLADAGGAANDAVEAPELCCSAGETQLTTDENGRAYFGEVAVVQDSGRMPAGSLLCTLELQVLVPRVKSRRSSSTTGSWSTVWQRQVLFTDDASRIRELQTLQEQKEQLEQQLAAVKESMQETCQRLQTAQQEEIAATKAVSKQIRVLKQKLQSNDLELPGTSKEAQKLVQQLQHAVEGQDKRPGLEARYGGQRHSMTLAVTKLLQLGDPELVGVFAQLGYVNEPRLSAVLAANYSSSLQVVVVKTYEAINRLRAVAQEQHLQAIPSMTSYSLIQEYTPEGTASNVQMLGTSELAQRLLDEACRGTDPPLPIPLPHTRSLCILESQGRAAPEGLNKDQWPEGCLGYAVNLVRPAMSNSRKGLLFAQLGRTLVFETIDQGAQYRQYAIKALRASVPDIVTLDGSKLSGRGVVLGSGFRVVQIEETQCRFGTIPASHQVAGQQAALQQTLVAAETAVTVLQQQEAAAEELAAAQAAADAEDHQRLEQQHTELQQQLKELSEMIRQQQHSIESGSRKSNRSNHATQRSADTPEAINLADAEIDAAADKKACEQQEARPHRSKRRRH